MIRVGSAARVWVLLLALTFTSVLLAESAHRVAVATAAIFGIAAIKAELLAARYMEIGQAAPHWRVLYRLWIVGMAVLLTGGHLLG